MRTRLLRITPELLIDAMRNPNVEKGFRLTSNGIPDDLRIVGCTWDSAPTGVVLVVESAEFDVVPEGGTPPDHLVTFTNHFSRKRGHLPK